MNRNKKTLLILCAVIVAMVGLSFASVPLYRMFCAATGFDGTPRVYAQPAKPEDARDQKVIVQFNADVEAGMPWDFKPEERRVEAQVGVPALTSYMAKNLSDRRMVGTAVYNVLPEKAAPYFNKTMCFCFGEQPLAAGQEAHLPVQFYIDPKFSEDPEMQDVGIITLSYTFYPAGSKRLDEALKRGYNRVTE